MFHRLCKTRTNSIDLTGALAVTNEVSICPMVTYPVKVYPSKISLPKPEQLAWRLASVATDKAPILPEVSEMVVNRIIDNAAVAIAAINREPVANARTQALAHPRAGGATLFGVSSEQRFDCEWAA